MVNMNGVELQSMTYNGVEVQTWTHDGVEVYTGFNEPFYVIEEGVLQANSYTSANRQLGTGGHTWSEQNWGNSMVNISQDGYCACSVSFDTKGAPKLHIVGDVGAGYQATQNPNNYRCELIVMGDGVEIAKFTYERAIYTNAFNEAIDIRGYKNITVKPIVTCIAYRDQPTQMIAKLTSVYCYK